MTLEEKVGQMNMPCAYENGLGESREDKLESCRKFTRGELVPGLGPAGGFFTLPNTLLHVDARRQTEILNELQKMAKEGTRLHIPLLITEEGTHGLMCSGATIFPEGLALGSTWDLKLLDRVYRTVALQARTRGVHQLFTLVVEPYRDPRLGRSQEGFSEDPYLCSRIAEVIVGAIQKDDLKTGDSAVAGLCHYPGQSQPVSGLERGAMEISERSLRSVFLPSWVAGIRDAGALGVMATYPSVDGIPTHGSSWLLTEILREELGFKGLVLSEGGGIGTLVYEGLAADQKQAGILAVKAGVDVGISFEEGYMKSLVDSVQEGSVSEDWIDRSVRRILHQKMRLGLFENSTADPDKAERASLDPKAADLALETARQGIVLLKNQGDLLPLRKDLKSVAVIGPNADHLRNQLGDYTPQVILQHVVTVLEGIRNKVGPGTKVEYARGCDVDDPADQDIAGAVEIARRSQVAIVVLGENEWQAEHRRGTSGEGFDAATLELTGRQEELVKAVVATGTPTVVVLVNGRPLAVPWIAENVPAVVETWSPGEQGGNAVADVLFGDVNPTGRLPVTIPRHVGQLPVYYNYPKSKEYWIKEGWGRPYVDLDPRPLWVFGHGLSYTTFEYSGLVVNPGSMAEDGVATVRLKVRNSGKRDGSEVVQLYVRDPVASVSTPVLELRGFRKTVLKAGEAAEVTFTLGPSELALLDRHLEWKVEPGEFEILVGASSSDIRLRGRLQVRPN